MAKESGFANETLTVTIRTAVNGGTILYSGTVSTNSGTNAAGGLIPTDDSKVGSLVTVQNLTAQNSTTGLALGTTYFIQVVSTNSRGKVHWVGSGSNDYPNGAAFEDSTSSTSKDWRFSLDYNSIANVPAVTATFTQEIVLAGALAMPSGGQVRVVTHVSEVSGLTGSLADVKATLNNGATTVLALSNPVYDSTAGTLTWSGNLASNVNLSIGARLSLVIANDKSASSFKVNYDSKTAPSRIELPTTTVIALEDVDPNTSGTQLLGFFNSPFVNDASSTNDGTAISSIDAGGVVYVRTKVSDPFGDYDIKSLGIQITGPDGTTSADDLALTNVTNIVDTAGDAFKIYEYIWNTSNFPGEYSITVLATEGNETTPLATATTTSTFTVTSQDLGTQSITQWVTSAGVDATDVYPAGTTTAYLQITDLDENTNATTAQTITATVNGASFTLTETGANTGIFRVTIASGTNGITIANGSVLNANYVDKDNSADTSSDIVSVGSAAPILDLDVTNSLTQNMSDTFVENAVPVGLVVSDVANPTLIAGSGITTVSSIVVRIATAQILDGANEILSVAGGVGVGASIALNTSATTAQAFTFGGNTINNTPSTSGSDKLFTFAKTSGTFTIAEASALINALGYQVLGQNPTSGTRNLRISVVSGSVTGNTATAAIAVQPVNDTPWIDLNSATTPRTAQTTALTFASQYDPGDVVSLVVDGVTYQQTVTTGGRSAQSVYTALLSVVGSNGVSLANSLANKGVTWPTNLTSNAAALTSSVGSGNAFTLTATTNNTNGLGTAVYSLDWADGITPGDFSSSAQISVTILGTVYQSGTSSNTSGQTRFDAAGSAVATVLTNNGYPTTYNPSSNTLLITIASAAALTNSNVSATAGTLTAPTFSINTAFSAATSQANPSVSNSSTASDGSADFSTTFTEVLGTDTGANSVGIGNALNVSIADLDDTNIESARIVLTNPLDGSAETLSISGTLPTGITASSYNASTGVLTLSGSATLANYQTAILAIRYNNSSDAPNSTARIVQVFVNDGDDDSNIANTTISIVAVNEPPTAASFTATTLEDQSWVAQLSDFTSVYSDPESTALSSITITGLASAGTLEFYNGTSWVSVTLNQVITAASLNSGFLRLRPVANANGLNYSRFQYTVSDGTASSASAYTVTINVTAVNDAPVASGVASLASVNEDSANPTGSTVSSLFTSNFSDATDQVTGGSSANTLAGIAITAYTRDTAKGEWQYLVGNTGTNWVSITASVSQASALVLTAADGLRFLPAANFNGPAPTLTVRLIESSASVITSGTTVDTSGSNSGGTTTISSATVVLSTSVTAVNDAPIASGASTLASISEDSTNPAGDTVSNLFSARFNDSADQVTGGTSANSLAGIAITNYTRAGSKGEWQYSTDGGTSWTTISASISGDSSALTFLSTDRLRFLPKPDFNGPAPTLAVRLLETPRSITSGATVDVSTNGGSTTISGGTVVLSQSVSAVNDAPVASGSATLTAINEDTTNPQGSTVLNLFAGNFSDAKDQVIGGSNANNFLGVAVQVHTQDASRGYWEYTSDSSWPVNPPKLATVTGNNAILLRSTDRIRFVPALNYNGPATPLVVRLLDNSNTTTNAKTAGAIVDTSTNNGTTEISSALVTLTHTVNPVNDPPISTNNTITIDEDQVRPLTTADFGNYSDVENQPFSAIKIVTRPDKGTLQYNVGGVWTPITTNGGDYAISDASIKFRYIPAQNENGNNYTTIVYQVSDGVDFSASNYTVTINVTPVNDPPISTGDAITSDEDALYYFNLSDFGTYSDVEGDSLAAVQITSLPSLGTLEYDNGTGWVSALGAQIAPSLLTGNSDTSKLRYMPPANAFGSPFTQFGFKVSDGSAYSLDSYTVTINIAPVNDAPEATGSALLASVFKNDTNPAWATVSSLFSGNFSDPRDTGDTKDSFYGVAIRALTQDGAKGHWQYKIGSTVGDVPDSTDSSSFVLQGADSLRFVPASGYTGNATSLSVRLIETKSSAEATASGPSDASGSTANVSSNGGTTVYSAATVSLIHEVKGTLLVKAFNDVSEGSDAIFCVSLDSNASGTGVTLGLTSGTASSSSDYGPGYKEAYYYDGSNNKQTLTINGNSVSVPQGVTVFFVSVQTTNDSPKAYEGPETFTLSASITVDGNTISNSDAATIRDDGNGVVFNPDGTVNNSATPDNDLSVSVTGYGPVNEGSTYAMFKVDASSGDALNLSVINGTATLVTPMIEFSLNGTTWTLFNASATGGFPTVPAGAGNIGTVYVRVTITSESDSMYEGSESFSLKATSRTNSSTSDTKSTSIVDDGTGLKYAGDFTSGSPDTNATSLDNDLSVSVTSYSPVNEGSTWAMFKVVGTAGDTLSLNVTDIETSLSPIPSPNVPPMWHSINGTSWTLYSSSNKPTVPGTSGTGIVYVRVNITDEQETALDTSERFTLTATSNGQGNKSGSADTMILDNGSGTLFTGDFGNDLPQVSSNFRDDDRVIAVRDKVFSRTASGVVLTDVRANDTTRNGATISAAIGLNPLSSTVSSTFSNAEGTWTVLSGGEVRFAPVASQKTDPTPIDYAVSVDNGSNYSLNKAQLFVDYGVGVVPDSVNAIPSTQEFVRVDVLLNDTLADTYDSDTLKLVDVSNGNALVEFLDVVGQGVWRVVAGTGSSLGRKVLEFQANMSGGVKSFAGNPSPVTYAVRDLVTDGGYRGGNLSSFTTATISYAVSNANPFLIRINDRNNDATSNGLPWDVIVVDNKLAGESVDLYDENGIWSQTIVTTAADASKTVGQIFYQGATTNFSTVKVDAKSKPVTVGSVANINLSTTTQSRRAAAIEIQAFDSLFIAQSTSSTNVLVSPMSGTQSSGSTTTFRESLGRVNQLFPTSSILGSTAGNVVENHQSSTARTVSISRTSGQFSQTAGQSTSLMKSLVTTNTGASQVVSLNAGGKVVESDPDGSVLAGINGWFFGVGLSKALEEARTLEQSGAWTTAIFMPSSEGMNAQGSQKTFENFENSVTTFGVSDSLRDVSVDEVIMVSNAFVNLESEDASRSKKVLANDLRTKKIGKRQES
jgi:hypothetical protein